MKQLKRISTDAEMALLHLWEQSQHHGAKNAPALAPASKSPNGSVFSGDGGVFGPIQRNRPDRRRC